MISGQNYLDDFVLTVIAVITFFSCRNSTTLQLFPQLLKSVKASYLKVKEFSLIPIVVYTIHFLNP